ncbi:hypothetical protein ACHAWF_005825 [Thalassiosira exigua]
MIQIYEIQATFRSVREKTSLLPSGIHYTFWKAIASNSENSSYMVIMMCLPFMYGFKNDRWAKCLDAMLEKKPGVCRIHQLRIIGLVEADFNTALKLFIACHLIGNAELTPLSEEQWGERPGRTAVEPAFCKMLAFEYSRVMYVTITLFVNDAAACFDRMVPDITSLIARRHGMCKSVVEARNEIMKDMEHAVQTKHGDSDLTYCQEPGDVQLDGEGQWKGNVASAWSVLSQTLLKANQELHEGLVLPHVENALLLLAKNNDGFVDETDGMASKLGATFYLNEKLTVKHLKKGAHVWANRWIHRSPQMPLADTVLA